jgi:hypothetical protein
MAEERLKLGMSVLDAFYAMTEGNPGALMVCVNIEKHASAIDPDNAFGWLGVIMHLDTSGIYGPRIWMLYKNVCDEHLGKMIALLRANQLGLLSTEDLNHAIDDYGDSIDAEALVAAVQERLPNFCLEPAAA